MKNLRILLIGFRRGAVQAARKLGCTVFIWHEKPIPKKYLPLLEKTICAELPLSETTISHEIFQQLSTYGLEAVIATTEKAVVVAARIRALLNLPGINYSTALRCHDKAIMKLAALQAGVKLTPYADLGQVELSKASKTLGFPVVLKQRCLSGSREIEFIYNEQELKTKGYQQGLLEKLIVGKEYSVESFIQNGKIIWRNITEYYLPHIISILPAHLPPEIINVIDTLNTTIIDKFQIERGMTHLELYHNHEGVIFGEIALRPPGGYLMELIRLAYGFDAWQAFFAMELGLKFDFVSSATQISAGWILHPGAGSVRSIQGLDQLSSCPEVKAYKLKVRPGSIIAKRLGVGEDCGYILLSTEKYPELIACIEKLQQCLAIRIDTDLAADNATLHG